MQELPKQAKNEHFSVAVLVYDENDPTFCEIGHYNFDTKQWSHFGENSMKLICWCYLPSSSDFLILNKEVLKSVTHEGYRP